MKNVLNIVFLFTMVISFSSCGYKPSAKFARAVVGEKVSTNVKISSQDPQNTALIKDALDSAIIEVFHASLTSRKYSNTHLDIELKSVKYDAVAFDKDGYIIAYRATTYLDIYRSTYKEKQKYLAKGTYDFSVAANAVITDNERYNAIKFSSQKAIKSFVSQVSSQGAR